MNVALLGRRQLAKVTPELGASHQVVPPSMPRRSNSPTEGPVFARYQAQVRLL